MLKGVKGNGIGLGLTDGTNNATVFSTTNGNVSYAYCPSQNYGATTGSPWNQGSGSMGHDKVIGITTDSSKSGIESDISSNVNYIIKY